ncbi:MAG: aminotransferase class I/II-fold pyridoxal phosphate-dependent enzyme [Deltaproteobacteria bacterium]|nr:aminotransferase class I/II-fold pyridoxal phosphate-dependent enzyme [Deltaproteobacteria bacterium]
MRFKERAVISERLWAQRARGFGETIFAEMTALALKHDAVNLGQGFPDFDPPPFVMEAAQRAMADASTQQYARGSGELVLTEIIAEESGHALGRSIDPTSEVTITVGATEALFAATLALVEPGDEVILFEPFYDSYPANVSIAGGTARYVPLRPGADGRWTFDQDELAAVFSARTKLIVLNTPHNPTGKVFRRDELEQIAGLCQRHDVLALCDEVYEHLAFDGKHLSLASLPQMWERCLVISSAGKTFSVTGWKIGWVVAPPHLSLALRRIHQWIPFAVATPLQHAVAASMRVAKESNYYSEFLQLYAGKRKRLMDALTPTPLRAYEPEGTYFVMADLSESGYESDVELCRALPRDFGVAAIPPSVFYGEKHRRMGRKLLRFAFCKRDATLDEAARRLAALP